MVNHSSDEHAWFKASRSSKSDPKRDWYIWRPPRFDEEGNKKEPNNWKAQFQGKFLYSRESDALEFKTPSYF